jgi:YbgC/YbaW family acyl-CoA thioester hydrolase
VEYKYGFQLGLASVDRAGVVFFAELFRHAHDAYETFMAHLDVPLSRILEHQPFLLPIVHAEADYKRPLRHGDRVEVVLRVQRIGNTSFTLSYEFKTADGALCNRVQTVHACIHAEQQSAMPIPDELRGKLIAYCADLHPPS